MTRIIPYLLSDGVDGLLLSCDGKCLVQMQRLEEIRVHLNAFTLIWIDREQSSLRSLPELGKRRIRKCLNALSHVQNYTCYKEVSVVDGERTFLYCSTRKNNLDACLETLAACRIKSVIPLEMFLWDCHKKTTVLSLTWKDETFAVYNGIHGPQIVKTKLLENGIESIFGGGKASAVLDLIQDKVSLPKLNCKSYQVKQPKGVYAGVGLEYSFAMASFILILGAVVMHFRGIDLAKELRHQISLYEEQVSSQREYQQDLALYSQLYESIRVLEQFSVSAYRAHQIDYLVQSMSLERLSSLDYSVDSSRVSVSCSLEENTAGVISKAQAAVDVLGATYSLNTVDDAHSLKILSDRIHN